MGYMALSSDVILELLHQKVRVLAKYDSSLGCVRVDKYLSFRYITSALTAKVSTTSCHCTYRLFKIVIEFNNRSNILFPYVET